MTHIYFVGGNYMMTEKAIDLNLTFVSGYRWIKSRKTFSLTKRIYNLSHYELVSTDCQKFMQENGKFN